MKDRKAAHSGRPAGAGERKSLIRALYDSGSRLEIRAERGIVKLAKTLSALLRRNGE